MESDSSSPPGTAGAAARGTLMEGVDAAVATGDPTESAGSLYTSRGYFNMPSPAAAAAAAAAAKEEHYLVSDDPPEQVQQQQQQQTESRHEMSSSSIHPLQEDEEEEEQQQLRSGLHHNNQWILQATPPPLHDIVQPSSWPAEAAAGSSSLEGSSRLIEDMNSCGILPLCPDPALDFCLYSQTNVPLPASLCHSAAATETSGTCPPPSPAHSKGEPVETYDSSSNSGYHTPCGRSTSHYNSRLGNNYGRNISSEYDDGSSYAGSSSNGIYESSRSTNYSSGRSSSSSRTYDTGRCRNVDTGRHSLQYERISGSRDCDRGSTTSAHYHRSNSKTTHCDSNRDYDTNKKYEGSSSREYERNSSREYESKSSIDFENRSSREYESRNSREAESSSNENAAGLGCSLSTPLSPDIAAVAASVAAEAAAEAETDVEADPGRNGPDGLVKKASPIQRWATRDLSVQQAHDYLAAMPVDKKNNLAAAALPEKTSKERDISDPTGVSGSKQGRAAPPVALFDTCEPRSSATCAPHVQQQQLYSPLQQQADATAAATDIDTSQVAGLVEDTRCPLSPVAHLQSKGAVAASGIGGTCGERQRKRNAGGGGVAAGTASGSRSKGGAGRGGERRRKTQQQTGAAEKRDGERRQRRSNSNNEIGRGRGSAAGRGASRLQRNSLLLLPPMFPFADKPPVATSPCAVACKEAFYTTAQQLAAAAVMPASPMLMEGEEGGAAELTAALPLQEQQQRSCLDSGTHAQQQVKHASCTQSPLRYGAAEGAVSPLSPDPHPTLMSGAMAVGTQQQQQQQNRTSSFTNQLSSPLVLSGSAFRTLDACSNSRNGNSSRGSSNSTVRYTSPESLPRSSSSNREQQQNAYPRIMRTSASAAKATTAPATAQLYTFSPQQWDPPLSSDQPLLYLGGNPRTASSAARHLPSSSSHAAAPAAAALSTRSPPSSPLLPPFSSSKPLPTTSSSLGEAAAAASGRRLTPPGTGQPASTSPSGSLAAVLQAAAAGPGASSTAMTVGGSSPTSFCAAEAAAGEQSCCSSDAAAPALRYLSVDALDHTYSICSSSSAADRIAGTAALAVAPEVPQHQQEQQRETHAYSNTRGDSSGSTTLLNNSCARCSTYRSSSGNSSSRSGLTSPSGYESSNSSSSRFPNPPNSCSSNPSYSSTLSTSSPSYNNTSSNHLVSTYNTSGRFERSAAARLPQERQQLLQPDDNYGGCCEEVDQSAAGRNSKLSPTYHSRLQEVFAGLPSPSSSVAASCSSSHKGIGEPAVLPPHSRLFSFSSSSSTHPLHALDKHTSPENDSGTPPASPCESLTNAYSVGGAAGTTTIEAAGGTSCESLNSPAPTERLCGSSGCTSGGGGTNRSTKREKGSNGIAAGGGASSYQSASSLLPSAFSPSSPASAPSLLPATFPSTFSPSCSSALLQNSLLPAHRRGSGAAALRQPPAAAAGGRRLLVGGTSAAAGTAASEQQQQESFGAGGANGGDTLCEGLSSNIQEFNSTATAAATHMSILSNVLYSSYEPSNHLKAFSPFPLSAAAASMQSRDAAAAAAANGSPLGRHAAVATPAGNNAALPIGAAAAYNNPTPRALSPTTLSTQTSVHEDAVTTCVPENSSSSSTEVAAGVGGAAAGARSPATAVHALRQQQLGAQHLLFQATLQDALASTDSYAQPPLSYSNNSCRANGGVIGGIPSSSFSSSHIEELSAVSASNSATQQQQYPRCPAAGGSGGQFVCVPSLSSQNPLTNNVTAAAAATPCLGMFPPACVMLPNAARQQQQQSNGSSRVGEGNGRHHEAAVTIAADGWMTVASCCSGGSSRVEPEAIGGTSNAAWQDPQQQEIRDCFQYYLRERQHHAGGFCTAAAATGFAATAAAPLHTHYKRRWGREDVVAEEMDATAAGTATSKKFKLDGALHSRNAVLGEDDWQEGHTVAAEAAAAALVAAAAAGACSAAGAGAANGTCNNAAAAAPGDGSSCCNNSGSASGVGGPLRLPRKIFNDGRGWTDEFMEESDVDIDPNIQWHEGFTLPLGKDGRGELIKRMRAVHKADREFYRFTLEEMGIDFKRLAHATVEELWKIAFRWGLFPYAIRLSRKYGRTNATSSRKKTLAVAGAGTVAAGAAGGDAGTGRFPLSHSSSCPSSSPFPSSSSNASAFPSTSGPQHAPAVSSTTEAKSSMPAAEEAAQTGAVSTTCEPPDLSSSHAGSFCAETVNVVADVDWV